MRAHASSVPTGAAALVLLAAACTSDDPAGVPLPGYEAPSFENVAVLEGDALDRALHSLLAQHGFTGTIDASLEGRLGRRVNSRLAHLGQLVFFDPLTGLNDDNSCSGCHSPTAGFGDSQSIAVG